MLIAGVPGSEDGLEPNREPTVELTPLNANGTPSHAPLRVPEGKLAQAVRQAEAQARPRWVWERTGLWYPELLRQGVSVDRCHDLQLCGAILGGSSFTKGTKAPQTPSPQDPRHSARSLPADGLPPRRPEDAMMPPAAQFRERPRLIQESLFGPAPRPTGPDSAALIETFVNQLNTVRDAQHPTRISLLLAAESAGALIAAEMQHTGLPWRTDKHESLLAEALGPKPTPGHRPAKMEELVSRLRAELAAPGLNPDSAQDLTRALLRAGIQVKSTRNWELERINHPAIPVLLEYRKLSRLFSANGWTWLEHWVRDGRFRPEYVVGGVVSGRWSARGGGALQIPRQVRSAVQAAPGWKLIVADAAQLEPRVLAALARDDALARAAQGKDLYRSIAAQGFGERAQAKIALLGAIYGATTGEAGRLIPQLSKLYPRAVQLVEEAARAGERGEVVTTFLGRSCPPPEESWYAVRRSTDHEQQRRADTLARSRGRFTRNFVVQGSAAEWASCWLAEVRRGLRNRPQLEAELVFFLHDEVMVHCPGPAAEEVSTLIAEAARRAKELIFGPVPVDFPVNVVIADRYDEAK